MPEAVLLTGVGKRYDIVASFAQHTTVVAADPNPLAPAQYAATVRTSVPRIADPEYVPALMELCERHDVGAIVPGSGDGLLIAASGVDEGSPWQRSLVVRLDATTGAPDPRFAGDGVRSLPFDTVQWGTRLVRDAAGRVTIAGQGANRLLAWRVTDVDPDVTPSGGETPAGGGVVAPPSPSPGPATPPAPPAPPAQDAPSQQPPPVVAGAPVHRPAAWFHRVRSATRLKGEADQGAARVQVSITRRDGRRCRAVTSTRRARLGSAGACTLTRARWLTATSTPRAGRTQVWSLRLARRLPAGRYTATVRALDREGVAGRIGEISFRVR